MIEPVATAGITLDLVLLGSRLAFGPLESVLLSVIGGVWLLFGIWLWRTPGRGRGGLLTLIYVVASTGLFASVLAQDALLFYTGLAAAGYGTVAALLLVHGADHARTASAHAMLLVLADLILFELLVYLYADAQTADFAGLRAAYHDKGGGLSFVGALLCATAACRVAPMFLMLPIPRGPRPWRIGAAPGLLCTGLSAGLLSGARLVDPALSTPGVWTLFLAVLGAALALYLLVVACVCGRAGLEGLSRRLAAAASRTADMGAGCLVWIAALSARLAPRFQALERSLLSWPVAVATATAFAVLFAFASAGVSH